MTESKTRAFTVRVPASAANLGPGFDVMGLALTMYNEVHIDVTEPIPGEGPQWVVEVEGEGRDVLPRDESNLVFRAMRKVLSPLERPALIKVHCLNRVPLDRGLGSSSAAIVGGLIAANESMGRPFTTHELLVLATDMEGHPDNVTPALFGGLCVSVKTATGVLSDAWKDPALFEKLRVVVCIPEFKLPTKEARAVLESRFSREDAVFNTGRVALFLSAMLHQRYNLLLEAMEDRLHQSARKIKIPGFDAVILAAKKAGAYGGCLSGAGPTMLAFTSADERVFGAVGEAMRSAFGAAGVDSRSEIFSIDTEGARVIEK